ncbi:DUF3073 domain-containing protein [Curtobacterium sp. MCBD17_032]|uniref:DUF3073 domain-containing protein n=1 Tax=Curtobacterium sp. MCBD17_032 TaxID=2175659 RepID=UPI000DAA2B11|nr:DUF3073 domain-containing protein [Curtobacterium sp. MCBD17_032]PZE86327.1 DUF3073 domain-containing protein [Curtobacterium sp. MCBD17_032]
MGRGRQKAKHTKVARELKYFSPDTNYGALERELSVTQQSDEPDYVDRWADEFGDDGDLENQTDTNKSA